MWSLVRSVVAPWDKDRFMSPDIERVAQLVREGAVWDAVKTHIDKEYHQLPEAFPAPAKKATTSAQQSEQDNAMPQ